MLKLLWLQLAEIRKGHVSSPVFVIAENNGRGLNHAASRIARPHGGQRNAALPALALTIEPVCAPHSTHGPEISE
jgi:hypothetical protein